MLVLVRKIGEVIAIGDNVKITVVDVRGDKVRLGIEAPTEIPIHRQEIYEAIQRGDAIQYPPAARNTPVQHPSLNDRKPVTRLGADCD